MNYFNISTAIVDRTDLTIYEKMACVVMARYANRSQFDGLLNIAVIADKMGVTPAMAQKSLDQLVQKGLLTLPETLTMPHIENSRESVAGDDAQLVAAAPNVSSQKSQVDLDAPLTDAQSAALLAELAADSQQSEVRGRRLNSQINMNRVKKLYAKKK